ncbi:hypothetical protein BJ508DRAFT_315245 [Ascobolus immersus RN42]|uniref:Uncharacterized protein n=1 Tax=Ascobolus immersus RN42 TaxID=1160509 RepID=A0A3N4HFC1_ASCIM|nr:hypothetical protein BJ508DRAFT_315245 [Ascobolus immersus RN42]
MASQQQAPEFTPSILLSATSLLMNLTFLSLRPNTDPCGNPFDKDAPKIQSLDSSDPRESKYIPFEFRHINADPVTMLLEMEVLSLLLMAAGGLLHPAGICCFGPGSVFSEEMKRRWSSVRDSATKITGFLKADRTIIFFGPVSGDSEHLGAYKEKGKELMKFCGVLAEVHKELYTMRTKELSAQAVTKHPAAGPELSRVLKNRIIMPDLFHAAGFTSPFVYGNVSPSTSRPSANGLSRRLPSRMRQGKCILPSLLSAKVRLPENRAISWGDLSNVSFGQMTDDKLIDDGGRSETSLAKRTDMMMNLVVGSLRSDRGTRSWRSFRATLLFQAQLVSNGR